MTIEAREGGQDIPDAIRQVTEPKDPLGFRKAKTTAEIKDIIRGIRSEFWSDLGIETGVVREIKTEAGIIIERERHPLSHMDANEFARVHIAENLSGFSPEEIERVVEAMDSVMKLPSEKNSPRLHLATPMGSLIKEARQNIDKRKQRGTMGRLIRLVMRKPTQVKGSSVNLS